MRYNKILMDKKDGANRTLTQADRPESDNFRIVSHYGERDWSPFVGLREALNRFDQLPEREDGFFLLVEG